MFTNYSEWLLTDVFNLQPLADYLAGNIPFRHVGNKKYGDQSNKSEYKELFEAALKNQVSNVSKLRRQHKYERAKKVKFTNLFKYLVEPRLDLIQNG